MRRQSIFGPTIMSTYEARKLREVGKSSYVVTMPLEWAQKITEEYGVQKETEKKEADVAVSSNDERVSIIPLNLVKLYGNIKAERATALESKVISAYISGYDEITIESPSNLPSGNDNFSPSAILCPLIGRLSETSFKQDGDKLIVNISEPKRTFKELLELNYRLYKDMYNGNLSILSKFDTYNEKKELLSFEQRSKKIEEEIDNNTFLGKRYLNKSIYDPGYLKKIGLSHELEIIEQNSLLFSIEGLGDLQEEILGCILKLIDLKNDSKEKIQLDSEDNSKKFGFRQYLEKAYQMADEAFMKINDSETGYKILDTKNNIYNGISYRSGYLEPDEMAMIHNLLKCGVQDSDVLVTLTRLENKIWAMTGVATNIAEVGRNIDRPKRTN